MISTKEVVNPKEFTVTFARGISSALRADVLAKLEFYCSTCGSSPYDIDEITGRQVQFRVEPTEPTPKNKTLRDLRVVCHSCSRGLKQLKSRRPTRISLLEKPSRIWLLAQIRRARQDDQVAALNWLRKKFEP